MEEPMLGDLSKFLTPENLAALIRVALMLGIGFPLLITIAALVGRTARKRLTPQSSMLAKKLILYLGTVLLLIMVLSQLGFKLTALLGAAGIAGLAIGFAAQTSVSNIISGVFLIGERPFEVGDLIKVGDTLGTVLSIDLLSVKLQTLDNQFVRLPNAMLIGSTVVNITRFPIRRLDINVGVAYKEDVSHVRRVLFGIARKNPYCLDEPEPLVLFTNFGDSALEFLFGVWFAKADYLTLRNSIMQEIKERFDAEGIEIPFPHRTIYTGEVTKPFPVQLAGRDEAGAGGEAGDSSGGAQ